MFYYIGTSKVTTNVRKIEKVSISNSDNNEYRVNIASPTFNVVYSIFGRMHPSQEMDYYYFNTEVHVLS